MVRAAGRGRGIQWTIPSFQLVKHPPKVVYPRPLELVTRAEWSAAPWVEQATDIRLRFPLMHIRHTFTDTDECQNREECIPFLQQLQRDSQEKGFPDLMYNFLIGSDGMLYEGRGFDWKCTVFADPWVHDDVGESLNIAYIGKFHDVVAPWRFRLSAKILTDWMFRKCLLHEQYSMTPSICWPESYDNRPDIVVQALASLNTDDVPAAPEDGDQGEVTLEEVSGEEIIVEEVNEEVKVEVPEDVEENL